MKKRKQVSEETITPWKIKAMCATLQLPEEKIICPTTNSYILQPGWHQLFCLPTTKLNELSDDGYEDDFAPPHPYIARMWGGSKLSWNIDKNTSKAHQIKVGDTIQKTTTVENVFFKNGRKSGDLAIVDLVHEYSRADDNQILLKDNVSMIYRTQAFSNPITSDNSIPHAQSSFKNIISEEVIAEPENNPKKWVRTMIGTPVLLFRYSALTFNAHMIHYDVPYSNSEGFQNTLVHGPLQAQLLLNHVSCLFPHKSIKGFEYRAFAPLLSNTQFQLIAEKGENDSSLNVFVSLEDTITTAGAITFF